MKRFTSIIILVLLLGLLFYAFGKISLAATLEVGISGYAYESIQSAIDAAADGDIVIIHPGRYFENINFTGKSIKVTCENSNDHDIVSATIIDGNQVTFSSNENENSILEGLSITNGKSSAGSGILCLYSSPEISKCIISKNTARYSGGGILLENSPSKIIISQ